MNERRLLMRRKASTVAIGAAALAMGLVTCMAGQGSAQSPKANSAHGPWTEDTLSDESPWSSQPILSDLLYERSFTGDLQAILGLSDGQMTALTKVAESVLLSYRELDNESRPIVTNPSLRLDQKQRLISDMGYNRRVVAIVNNADTAVKAILSAGEYPQFLEWARKKYEEARAIGEQYKYRPAPDPSNFPKKVLPGQR
jgi:hypothetical protein